MRFYKNFKRYLWERKSAHTAIAFTIAEINQKRSVSVSGVKNRPCRGKCPGFIRNQHLWFRQCFHQLKFKFRANLLTIKSRSVWKKCISGVHNSFRWRDTREMTVDVRYTWINRKFSGRITLNHKPISMEIVICSSLKTKAVLYRRNSPMEWFCGQESF
jgi:hypothetical protein